MLRSNCLNGQGPADSTAHVVWKSAAGSIKAVVDVATTSWGAWDFCSASRRLAVGDTIRARSGPYARTFTMPRITLKANRVSETFRGIGLPGATGELWFQAGIFADFWENEPVTANGQGHWSFAGGASGGIPAYVDWATAKGDFLTAQMVVPYVGVTIGRAAIEGGGRAFTDATVKVRDGSSNALLGWSTAEVDVWGFFSDSFKDSAGHKVAVQVGDRIVSNIASNLDWQVPGISGEADVDNDVVYGQCGSTEIVPLFAMVRVFRYGKIRGVAIVNADENGEFAADFVGTPGPWYRPANIKHGDRIVIGCYYDTYDLVNFPFRVP